VRDAFARGMNSTNTNYVANNPVANKTNWAGSFNGVAPPGNYGFDPQIVNRPAGDLHLKSTSPLVDRGLTSVPYRMDPDGQPGAVDGDRNGTVVPDIGAYEVPVATLSVVHDRVAGTVTTSMTGPTGFFGAAMIALDEAVIRLPFGTFLLDPGTLAPLSTPVGVLPTTFGVPLSAPAGAKLVLQGVALDGATAQLHLATQGWVQW
jgi:hypothetical protein